MRAKRHTIALYLPSTAARLIVYGQHVVEAMTNNAWFPDPNPPLPTLGSAIGALVTAQATALGRGEGAAAARDVARKRVEDLLIAEKQHVQGIINANPMEAAAIAQSAGMSLKPYTRFHKPEIAAMLGPTPNQVVVRAKAVAGRVAYEWQYSIDGGQIWIGLGITNSASIIMQEATSSTTYLFRFRTTRKNQQSAWSSTATLVVH